MRYFQYGSRVVENEQTVRFQNNVKRIGRAFRAVVNFLVAICIFTALNSLLHSLAHHTGLFSFSSASHILQESANMLVNNDALSFISYMYEHALCIMFSFAISCACSIVCLIFAMSGVTNDEQNAVTFVRNDFSQSAVDADTVISYRHKVCFLA